jgi:hypothetical protein
MECLVLSRRERLFWLCVGFVFFIGFLSLIPSHYEICEVAEKAKPENCSTYRVLPFLVVKIGKALDDHNGAVTAFFTVILAGSTIGLWISTRKLWVSAKASEVALKTLERPYVVIDPRTNNTDALTHFAVHIVNHGRSLAFAGVTQGDFFIQDEPPRQFTPLKEHEQGVHWVLAGHGKGKIVKWPAALTADQIARVRAGTDKLYFVAVISYRDAAGNGHLRLAYRYDDFRSA